MIIRFQNVHVMFFFIFYFRKKRKKLKSEGEKINYNFLSKYTFDWPQNFNRLALLSDAFVSLPLLVSLSAASSDIDAWSVYDCEQNKSKETTFWSSTKL